MPRRDAISEKKKERLMQEHEQLQKLMLQARSSVRRSSHKENNTEPDVAGEEPTVQVEAQEEPIENKELHPEADQVPEVLSITQDASQQNNTFTSTSLPQEQHKPQVNSHHGRSIIVITPIQNTNVHASVQEGSAIPLPDQTAVNESGFYRTEQDEAFVADEGFRQLEEDQTLLDYERRIMKRRKRARVLSYSVLLLAALLAGFGGYYFYMKTSGHNPVAARQKAELQKPVVEKPSANSSGTLSTTENKKATNTAVITNEAGSVEAGAAKPVPTKSGVTPKTETPAAKANISTERYKVLSKAYFYNEPGEGTRRKAFITHWNNAVLTPLDEKNGYIYIIFTNHLGQTSKGWLRKKDLQKLN